MAEHVDSRCGIDGHCLSFSIIVYVPLGGLFPKPISECKNSKCIGSTVCQAQCHTHSLNAVLVYCIEKSGPYCKRSHKHYNLTPARFLLCLTQSLILHQDSKNTHAIAYLSFLLFHFIIVPIIVPNIVPLLFICFPVHAVFLNWLRIPWSGHLRSPTLSLIAKDA